MATKRAEFSVVYDGPALRGGLIQVRELAPAMLSFGELVERANALANHGKAHASLMARAGFEKGSFELLLALDVSFVHEVANLLFESLKDAKELIEIVFGSAIGSGGLWGLYRLLKRRADKAEAAEGGAVSLTINNTTIQVYNSTYQLSEDPVIRKAAADTLAPLRAAGINRLSILGEATKPLTVVEKDEALEIIDAVREDPGGDLEAVLDNTSEAVLRLVKPSFRDSLKWNFTWSGNPINATMRDTEFLDSVHRRERSFADGDVLVVRLRTISKQDSRGNLKWEHEIVRVLQHAGAGAKIEQLELER